MRCPGCGAEIAESGEYCSGCGGKITGSTVDYSLMRKMASDVYQVSSQEPAASETLDQYDEHMANVRWVGFALALVSVPFLAAVFIAAGLAEGRTDMLYVGVFLVAVSILLTALAVKFYKGEDTRSGKGRRETSSRFSRRI